MVFGLVVGFVCFFCSKAALSADERNFVAV